MSFFKAFCVDARLEAILLATPNPSHTQVGRPLQSHFLLAEVKKAFHSTACL